MSAAERRYMSEETEPKDLRPLVRRPEFRFNGGGIIREANLEVDAPAVLELYKSNHAIEHLAWVTPKDTVEQLLSFYERYSDARLFVAALPDGRIVGAITVAPEEEERLRSAKLNRLVVAQEHQRKNIAHLLIRQALSYAFSIRDAGGLGCEQVLIGIIQDVPGFERATRAFEKFGFDYHGGRLFNRCESYSLEENARAGRDIMVNRDVRQMLLQRRNYVFRYGGDLMRTPEPPQLPS